MEWIIFYIIGFVVSFAALIEEHFLITHKISLYDLFIATIISILSWGVFLLFTIKYLHRLAIVGRKKW